MSPECRSPVIDLDAYRRAEGLRPDDGYDLEYALTADDRLRWEYRDCTRLPEAARPVDPASDPLPEFLNPRARYSPPKPRARMAGQASPRAPKRSPARTRRPRPNRLRGRRVRMFLAHAAATARLIGGAVLLGLVIASASLPFLVLTLAVTP